VNVCLCVCVCVCAACYFREAPPLLNVLIRDRSSGGKQFRSPTLHAMAAHCQRATGHYVCLCVCVSVFLCDCVSL